MSKLEIHAAEPANAERIGARRPRDAGRVHRHEKRGDALPAQSGPRAREDDRDGRGLGVGDPDLRPVMLVAVAASSPPASSGSRRRCPASGSDSANAPIASPEASRRSHCSFCAAPAGVRDQLGDERVVDDSETATVALGRGDRLDGERVAQSSRGRRRPSSFGIVAPSRPRPAAARITSSGNSPRLVDRRRPRRDDLARELLDRLLEGELFGSEIENHDSINAETR